MPWDKTLGALINGQCHSDNVNFQESICQIIATILGKELL